MLNHLEGKQKPKILKMLSFSKQINFDHSGEYLKLDENQTTNYGVFKTYSYLYCNYNLKVLKIFKILKITDASNFSKNLIILFLSRTAELLIDKV